MDNSYNEITIPELKTPDQSQGFNNAPIEDLQVNVKNNRNISQVQYFAMDVWSSAWATWDGTFRVLKLIWFNWDREKQYSQEIITALGSTTAKITKSYNIDTPKSDTISVPSWKVFEIYASFNSATQNLQVVNTTGSKRYLFWSNTTLTTTNQNISMINSGTDNLNIQLKFATSASDRPIFWFLIKIY